MKRCYQADLRTIANEDNNIEDDLQSVPNEEISMSKILDMVCAVRRFENIDKDNVEE
jgi:hypothetical protein